MLRHAYQPICFPVDSGQPQLINSNTKRTKVRYSSREPVFVAIYSNDIYDYL